MLILKITRKTLNGNPFIKFYYKTIIRNRMKIFVKYQNNFGRNNRNMLKKC